MKPQIIVDENDLFVFLKENFYPDLKRYEDRYEATDCYSEADKKEIELKARHSHYDEMIIEEMKYRPLVTRAAFTGRVPFYICSSPVGVWSWNLFTLVFKWVDRENLPVTSEFDDRGRIVKRVGFLPVDKAVSLVKL